jgi:hypothetical protein
MRVEDGSVFLGDADQLAAGTDLIIDNGAIVDLDGNVPAAAALNSVTLLGTGLVTVTYGQRRCLAAAV